MCQWLIEQQVQVIGLESTGVYWMPVVRALQQCTRCIVWLVNPLHVKKVPGRKTDVTDSQWLAKLVMHGLVSPSFVPSTKLADLRELTRFRTRLISHRTSLKNRILRALERAGIKLASVCSDVFGKSGRSILAALLEGKQTVAEMSDLAKTALRKKKPELERALAVSMSLSGQFIMRKLLAQLDAVDADLHDVDQRIQQLLEPFAEEVALLRSVPGLDDVSIAAILAETGPDMSVFPSANNLSAWAGLSPGSRESAGKHKAAAMRKGDKYLRTMLVEVAAALAPRKSKKEPLLWQRKYRQLIPRLGKMKALCAIARRILVAVYYVLRDRKPYEQPAPALLSPSAAKRQIGRLLSHLRHLGYEATLTPISTG
jgi:transposase